MRDALKFLLMLPVIIGAALLGIALVGLSVVVDSLEMSNKAKELPRKYINCRCYSSWRCRHDPS